MLPARGAPQWNAAQSAAAPAAGSSHNGVSASTSVSSTAAVVGSSGAGGRSPAPAETTVPGRLMASSTARKPSVVSSPRRAPRRSITALVTRVVPWRISPTSRSPAPWSERICRRPSSAPTAGSSAVVSRLCRRSAPGFAPVFASDSTKSVKVPPMSKPMRKGLVNAGRPFPMLASSPPACGIRPWGCPMPGPRRASCAAP